MDVRTRRIFHHNVTARPTAEWTLQQFREALLGDHPYRFVIHDRDSLFSKELDQSVTAMGVRVLRTPVRARTLSANASVAHYVENAWISSFPSMSAT
jgi:putative transposase